MSRTWWQKSPLTSSTRPAIRRDGSSARQPNSCDANGFMHAAVLPEPTAPKTAMPVNSPRSGMTSHCGSAAGRGRTGWCISPTTIAGDASDGPIGHDGSGPPCSAASTLPALQVLQTAPATVAPPTTATAGPM